MDPFCREQKKDSEASGIHKTTKNTPAFGTRVPERTFCVLHFGRAKVCFFIFTYPRGCSPLGWGGVWWAECNNVLFFSALTFSRNLQHVGWGWVRWGGRGAKTFFVLCVDTITSGYSPTFSEATCNTWGGVGWCNNVLHSCVLVQSLGAKLLTFSHNFTHTLGCYVLNFNLFKQLPTGSWMLLSYFP